MTVQVIVRCCTRSLSRLVTALATSGAIRRASCDGQSNDANSDAAAKEKLEKAKRIAAERAVLEWVNDGQTIGIGSGSTVVYVVQALMQRVKEENLKVSCVPSSFQARELIIEHKLPMTDLSTAPVLDVAIDGADEVDKDLVLIKGGGGCLLQEKIVASCAKNFIIVADYTKISKKLGEKYKKGLPIEVVPMAYVAVQRQIIETLGGQTTLRGGSPSKAGPCVTDNGNFIIDWHFPKKLKYDWDEIDDDLNSIPGIVETGLFVSMARKAYFGMPDGKVKILESE